MINQAPSTKQMLFRFSYLARDPWSMNLANGAAWVTRTPDPRIHHTTTFVATHLGVCALDFPLIIPTEVGLDSHRQVSTPSPCGAWLGIAILQVSPSLMGFHPKVSLWGRKNKSTNAMLYQLS